MGRFVYYMTVMQQSQNIKAVLFDFDGTLTRPGCIDFAAMRRAINCPDDENIISFIESIPDEDERNRAWAAIDAIEDEAAAISSPNHGAESVLKELLERRLPLSILTRNTARAVDISFQRFDNVSPDDFHLIITRDDPFPAKPEPHAVQHVLQTLQLESENLLVVGDYLYDIEAAQNAGCPAVFISNGEALPEWASIADHHITCLRELPDLIF